MNPSAPSRCHLCGSDCLTVVEGYERLHRVTSDCRPWPPGGRLASCAACGTDQAIVDETWRSEAEAIYRGYSIYQQSQGAEQAVFDSATGAAMHRSQRIVRRLAAEIDLPGSGRLLDLGCGNGAFLRAFHHLRPDWSLVGIEVNDRYRSEVEAIGGVEGLHTGPFTGVAGTFDLLVLIHVLEHVEAPAGLLTSLGPRLRPGGRLLIQVPDCGQNPFAILIADHATHFVPATLRGLAERSGFVVSTLAADWVAKEITLVCRPAPAGEIEGAVGQGPGERAGSEPPSCSRNIDWLRGLREQARMAAERTSGGFGLFGSSIAATWLAAELEGLVDFFVDEDPARRGGRHMGLPIHHPADVPAGARVFLALPDQVARVVWERVRSSYTHFRIEFELPGRLA